MPALLTSVSTRPKCWMAVDTTRLATSGSAMSPATVTRSALVLGLIERELATTR